MIRFAAMTFPTMASTSIHRISTTALAAIMLLLSLPEAASAYGNSGQRYRSSAGGNNVRRIEVEAGGGFIYAGSYAGNQAKPGMVLFVEARHNFPMTPFDVSLQAVTGSFSRKDDNLAVNLNIGGIFFADWNWRPGRAASPFIGLGIGAAAVESMGISSGHMQEAAFVLNPRIGIELFEHLRITLEYKRTRPYCSFLGLNVGFAFGGGSKK